MNIEAEHKSLLICKGELICGNFRNDQVTASMNTQLLSLMVSYLLQWILKQYTHHCLSVRVICLILEKSTLQQKRLCKKWMSFLWSPYWLNFWITKTVLEWLSFFQVWWRLANSNSEKEVLQHKILALLKFVNWLKLIVALREKYSEHLLRFPCKMSYLPFSF